VILPLIVATLSVAFPREGTKIPSVEKCYLTGAVPPGVTNVFVQGKAASVHPLGGWTALADVSAGENAIEVFSVDPSGTVTQRVVRNISVAPKKRIVKEAISSVAEKVQPYKKLPCAGDVPKVHPALRGVENPLVVLDPGHGGPVDKGAISPHSLPEKDANLRLAKVLKSELEKRGWGVIMTREDDSEISLFKRPEIAHKKNADVFVSIHHNAPPFDRDPRLFRYHCVYAWNEIGKKVAEAINRRMASSLKGSVKDNGVLHANYAVTRNPEIPSCLVEVDFISLPEGEIDSWSQERQKKVALAIAEGLDDWKKTP
jgi:N-acetylmuramoyl-L-alanine amidase